MAQAQQKAPRDIARPVPGRVSMAGLTGLRAPGTLLILTAAWCSSAAPGVTQRLMSSWKLWIRVPFCHSESRSRKKALMRKFTVRSMVEIPGSSLTSEWKMPSHLSTFYELLNRPLSSSCLWVEMRTVCWRNKVRLLAFCAMSSLDAWTSSTSPAAERVAQATVAKRALRARQPLGMQLVAAQKLKSEAAID